MVAALLRQPPEHCTFANSGPGLASLLFATIAGARRVEIRAEGQGVITVWITLKWWARALHWLASRGQWRQRVTGRILGIVETWRPVAVIVRVGIG